MTGAFLLGVGAQKAGTTWLSEYLKTFDEFAPGLAKEYHLWDALSVPAMRNARRRLLGIRDWRDFRLWMMQKRPASYFNHFQRQLAHGRHLISADITPSYSALSRQEYRRIKAEFARRGIAVKVIFLMRDPVDRCWSAVRMVKSGGTPREGVDVQLGQADALIRYCRSDDARLRTDYRRTVLEIEGAFEPAEVFYGIYENLFEVGSIRRLSDFLGLPARVEFGQRRIHATERSETIDPSAARVVARQFAQTYEFCGRRFPETRTLWGGFAYVGEQA